MTALFSTTLYSSPVTQQLFGGLMSHMWTLCEDCLFGRRLRVTRGHVPHSRVKMRTNVAASRHGFPNVCSSLFYLALIAEFVSRERRKSFGLGHWRHSRCGGGLEYPAPGVMASWSGVRADALHFFEGLWEENTLFYPCHRRIKTCAHCFAHLKERRPVLKTHVTSSC